MIKAIKGMVTDTSFLKKILVIGVPVALQGLLNTTVNLVDNLMIGTLGENAIAAVGLANKVFFVFSLLLFGTVSGSGILAAQYWGIQDMKNIRKVLGMSLLIGLLASALFLVPSVVRPKLVMRIFSTSEATIALGAEYLIIAAVSYPFTAVTNCYVAMLRAVNQVKAPVVISCMTILINITLNYIFIFGKFGAPAMGVAGAAVATLSARICEMIVLLLIIYLRKSPVAAKLSEMFGYSKEFLKKYAVTVTPVICNEFMWGLGVTMYSLAYGRMGDSAVAAITIAQTIQDLLLVLFQGLSAATAVILGNALGAGELKTAERYAKNAQVLQFLLTALMMVLCIAFRWQFIGLYSVSEEVAGDVSLCLIAFSLFMPFKMYNYVNVVGVLRSGGDTKFCLFLDCAGVWLIGIPLAFLGGLFWKLPIYIVYALVMTEEIFKFVLGIYRYRTKKWIRNLTAE